MGMFLWNSLSSMTRKIKSIFHLWHSGAS